MSAQNDVGTQQGRVTPARKAGKWYAVFACDVGPEPLPPTGREVGLDVGLSSLITTSDGEHMPHQQSCKRWP